MKNYPYHFYIFGKTANKKKFRPSDWAERFCGVLSSYRPETESFNKSNPRNLGYSPFVCPLNYKGEKVVFISREIEKIEPLAWKFITSFIDDNKLIFEEKQLKTESTNFLKDELDSNHELNSVHKEPSNSERLAFSSVN